MRLNQHVYKSSTHHLLHGALVLAHAIATYLFVKIAAYLFVKNDAYLRLDAALQVATGAAHLLRAVLFGISEWDPLSFTGVGTLFFLIASLAAGVPARRAALVDPMVAFRNE